MAVGVLAGRGHDGILVAVEVAVASAARRMFLIFTLAPSVRLLEARAWENDTTWSW